MLQPHHRPPSEEEGPCEGDGRGADDLGGHDLRVDEEGGGGLDDGPLLERQDHRYPVEGLGVEDQRLGVLFSSTILLSLSRSGPTWTAKGSTFMRTTASNAAIILSSSSSRTSTAFIDRPTQSSAL